MYQFHDLRERAEDALARGAADGRSAPSELRELVRELQIHQVELEMQNAELREAHFALEESRQKYYELYDLAPIGYLSLTATSEITDVNRAATALLGFSRDDLIGARFSRFVDPAHAEEFARHCRRVRASAAGQSCELELRGADGRRCEVRLESVHVAHRDGFAMRVALVDLTELHSVERELRETQKYEAVGSLASGVAHEFNNRLLAIVGCVEAAQQTVAGDSDTGRLLQQVKDAAMRGRSVTHRLLNFARKDSGDESAELDGAIDASVPMLRQTLGKRVQLQLDLHAPGARVRLGGGMVEQLLLTLAANARDAVQGNGTLRVETRRARGPAVPGFTAAEASPVEHVVLRCADDGSGMDAATRQRAFEPFFTTTPAGAGVGLGLALVHGIVKRAGGRIELTSAPGAGTEFDIHLPFALQAWLNPSPPDASGLARGEPALTGARVLVVEDEALIRSTIAHHLASLGCEIVEAASYSAAVAELRADGNSLSLVVSDVVLDRCPRGHDLAVAVERHAPGARVLFTSAHPRQALSRTQWVEPGARVLEKPFTFDQLRHAVLSSLS
jgi:PAS domain S-box-containing protein